MPIYEYQCQSCHKQSEFWQSIKDDPETKCPHCGEEALSRMISLSSFHLKGQGWYATDYGGKNGGSQPGANGDTNGDTNGDVKSEAKSDSNGTDKNTETKEKATSSDDSKKEKKADSDQPAST